MVDLFLDIETVPDFAASEYLEARGRADAGELTKDKDRALYWKLERGGLSPHDGRVVMITYQVNKAHTFRLKEWESSEKEILARFYNVLVDLQHGGADDMLRIIGHNILRFDLPFLYERMRLHGIAEDRWLYKRLMDGPAVADLLQMHMPLNGYQTRGLRHDALATAYGMRTKGSTGKDEIPHYFTGQYGLMEKYSEDEFIYPEMFARIQENGLASEDQLRRAIEAADAARDQ